MIRWISTWLRFFLLILVVVKFFVLFLLDESFLYQAGLKLTLMGLLGVSWSCYLWRYFPWEYEGVYWCFLYVSWSSDCYGCWVLWSYTCYGGSSKDGFTNVWLECDFVLICVVFTTRTSVRWMHNNRWNTCLNYCGKIRFRIIHIFREGNACTDKLVNLGFIHKESFYWYNSFPSSLFLEFFMNNTFFMWWQMTVVIWGVNLTEMSSCIMISNIKVFIKKIKYYVLQFWG